MITRAKAIIRLLFSFSAGITSLAETITTDTTAKTVLISTDNSNNNNNNIKIDNVSFLKDPLLLRVARGDEQRQYNQQQQQRQQQQDSNNNNDSSFHTPVWMMRQAGRHMQAYRDLVQMYPTFRQRSETPEISKEISLQPFRAYGVDGVILFSDILTPLPAMGMSFDIDEHGKIVIATPIRTRQDLQQHQYLKKIPNIASYQETCSFVSQVLQELRNEVVVGNTATATILGFVGLPFTLTTYIVEGQTGISTNFEIIKSMGRDDPKLLHDILSVVTHNIALYACFQIENGGAQVLQVFDSWAGYINDDDYEQFAFPYQCQVIERIQNKHPNVPIIIYMAPGPYSQNGRRLEQLVKTGANIISVDHTIDMKTAQEIIDGCNNDNNKIIGIQGNLDPKVLRDGPLEEIKLQTEKILSSIDKSRQRYHIMNLGHGILPDTPESHAAFFVKTVQEYRHSTSK